MLIMLSKSLFAVFHMKTKGSLPLVESDREIMFPAAMPGQKDRGRTSIILGKKTGEEGIWL